MRYVLLIAIALVTSCSTTRQLDYSPTLQPYAEAFETLDRLTILQRPGWRPNSIEITGTYIEWTVGDSTGPFGIGGEVPLHSRYYYASDQTIMLQAWRNDHYVVSLYEPDGRVFHIYRTDSIERAHTVIDSIHSIAAHYGTE